MTDEQLKQLYKRLEELTLQISSLDIAVRKMYESHADILECYDNHTFEKDEMAKIIKKLI